METCKKTILHDWHVAQGANMALFGGYNMPLWYKTGAKAEHLSVIERAGIFDTSHMAVVSVSGDDARWLLQNCLSKDLERCGGNGLSPLVDGKCVYGVFLLEDGTVLDDTIVYQISPERYMVVVNAGMGGVVSKHLQQNAVGRKVVVVDLTDRVGKMDIQGPLAAKILTKLLDNQAKIFEKMSYFSFKGGFGPFLLKDKVTLVDGTPVLISRTGYTGEFGFELFVDRDQLLPLWLSLVEAGKGSDMLACGLAARDSLRTGAVLPLSHQDIGHWPFLKNPWQFALSWNEDLTAFSKEFIGSKALLNIDRYKYTLPFAGFDPRKINAGQESCVTSLAGEVVGKILTCTTDMAIGRRDGKIVCIAEDSTFQAKGLSCGFVLVDREYAPGDRILLTEGKRTIEVEIRKDIRPGRTARKPMKEMLG